MRIIILLTVLAIAVTTVFAGGNPESAAKSSPTFDKLKSLAGTWKGKTDDGKPVTISYKVVSAGTSVMETLDMGDTPEAMITMYHLDGNKTMMTHYCSMGNQPRMKTTGLANDGKTLNFSYVDATNLASKKENHMYKLLFTFKDDDHFSQQWTMRMDGTMDHPSMFDFERVK